MRLSILNFFSPPHHAIELAQRCDQLGYHRFWVGEHHAKAQIPDALAFVMVAAGTTERIRIGTGAVSLVFRNPYLVAESAITAELFFPDRIDLGVTKAASVSAHTREQLLDGTYDVVMARYEARLKTLRDILAREDPSPDLFLKDTVQVGPPLFVMVTNAERARAAGEMGVGIVASFHHGGTVEGVRSAIAAYREHFKPSVLCPAPSTIVVVSGMVSDDPAIRAAATSSEEALRKTAVGLFQRTVSVFGGASDSAVTLRNLGAAVGADEVMFLCVNLDSEACYTDLARGWANTASEA
jgi:luciferase family oxidoreductase group 1